MLKVTVNKVYILGAEHVKNGDNPAVTSCNNPAVTAVKVKKQDHVNIP